MKRYKVRNLSVDVTRGELVWWFLRVHHPGFPSEYTVRIMVHIQCA